MPSLVNLSYVFPVEIFEQILEHDLRHQDVAAFAASSRWLNRIATRKLYKSIHLEDSLSFTAVTSLLRTIKTAPELAVLVEQLVLDWAETNIDDEDATHVEEFTFADGLVLPNVREMHVRGSAVAGAEGLIEIPTDIVRTCDPSRLTRLTWLPPLGDKSAPWPALPHLKWLQVSSSATVAGLRVCGGLSALRTLVYSPDKMVIDMEDAAMLSSVVLLLPQIETMCLDETAVVRLGLDPSRESVTPVTRVRRIGLLDGCALSCSQCHSAEAHRPDAHHCTTIALLIVQRVLSRFDGLETLDLDCRSTQWRLSTDEVTACGQRCEPCAGDDASKALIHAFNHELLAYLPESLRKVNLRGEPALERSLDDHVFKVARRR